jgi:hypothetical protein
MRLLKSIAADLEKLDDSTTHLDIHSHHIERQLNTNTDHTVDSDLLSACLRSLMIRFHLAIVFSARSLDALERQSFHARVSRMSRKDSALYLSILMKERMTGLLPFSQD